MTVNCPFGDVHDPGDLGDGQIGLVEESGGGSLLEGKTSQDMGEIIIHRPRVCVRRWRGAGQATKESRLSHELSLVVFASVDRYPIDPGFRFGRSAYLTEVEIKLDKCVLSRIGSEFPVKKDDIKHLDEALGVASYDGFVLGRLGRGKE